MARPQFRSDCISRQSQGRTAADSKHWRYGRLNPCGAGAATWRTYGLQQSVPNFPFHHPFRERPQRWRRPLTLSAFPIADAIVGMAGGKRSGGLRQKTAAHWPLRGGKVADHLPTFRKPVRRTITLQLTMASLRAIRA